MSKLSRVSVTFIYTLLADDFCDLFLVDTLHDSPSWVDNLA